MTLNKPERDKQLVQEKCQQILTELLRDEDNKYCVDCDSKGPRWASWNLGIFLCIRCAGIHRNLGVHISKVKSVNLDSWTPEQVGSIQNMGNSKARAVYEANLPDNFSRPQADIALETFIRAKYEHKKYIAKEWVETPPKPAFDVAAELKKEKEKKKNRIKPITGIGSGSHSSEIQSNPIPRPTPSSTSTPTTNGLNQANKSTDQTTTSAAVDLLGLDLGESNNNNNNNNDGFGLFTSANVNVANKNDNNQSQIQTTNSSSVSTNETQSQQQQQQPNDKTLADEEKDFFSQKSSEQQQQEKKLTKESILSLYSQTPALQQSSAPITNPMLNGFAPSTTNQVPFSSNPLFGTTTSTVTSSLSTNPFLTNTTTNTNANSLVNNNPLFNEFHQHQLIPGLSSINLQQQNTTTNTVNQFQMANTQPSSTSNWFNNPISSSSTTTMANPFMDQTTNKINNQLNFINNSINLKSNNTNNDVKPLDDNFNLW